MTTKPKSKGGRISSGSLILAISAWAASLAIAGGSHLHAQVCNHAAQIAECERKAAELEATAAKLSKGPSTVIGSKGGPSQRQYYEQAAAEARKAANLYRNEHAQKCRVNVAVKQNVPGQAPGVPLNNIAEQFANILRPKAIEQPAVTEMDTKPVALDPSEQQRAAMEYSQAKESESKKAGAARSKVDQEARGILDEISIIAEEGPGGGLGADMPKGPGAKPIINSATAGASPAPVGERDGGPAHNEAWESAREPDSFRFVPDDGAFQVLTNTQLGAPWRNLDERGGFHDVLVERLERVEIPPSKKVLEDAADVATRQAEAKAAEYELQHPGRPYFGQGRCARGVLTSLGDAMNAKSPAEFGSGRPFARDKGEVLEGIGMEAIGKDQLLANSPQKGDVAIVEPVPPGIAGHMAIWNGRNWVSDYLQPDKGDWKDSLYPNQHYRSLRPSITVYRRNN